MLEVRGATIWTGEGKPFRGSIFVKGEKIAKIVREGEAKPHAGKTLECKGCFVTPGLVNAHTHVAMTLLRGIGDDMPLEEWLEKRIWPAESVMDAEAVYWGTLLGIVEMLKTGTTLFADMYMFEEEVAKAAKDAGIRALVARGLADIDGKGERRLREALELFDRVDGKLVKAGLGPHAVYTCSQKYLEKVARVAEELKATILVHASETKREVEEARREYGRTPIGVLASAGILGERTVVAHAVWLEDGDLEALVKTKTAVAHCPKSNAKLGSGIADVVAMRKAGVRVCLGTDGPASNNTLDMVEEMRFCALLQKAKNADASVLKAEEVLKMATAVGANALGFEGLGIIKEGAPADFVIWDMEAATSQPVYNFLSQLVYSARGLQAKHVVINGRLVVEDFKVKTVDEEEVLKRVRRIVEEKRFFREG